MSPTKNPARSELLLYGSSHVGKSVLWQSADAFSLYFWSEIVGVDRLAAGGLFLIGMIWSGALDLVVGLYLTRKTAQRCRKFLLFGIPASAIAFAGMFAAPWLWPGGGLIAAAVTSILFRTAYAAIDVPQNFLMFDIARSSAQLGQLAGARTITGSATSILIAGAVGWFVVPNQPLTDAVRHFSIGGALAAAVSVPLLMACLSIRSRPSPPQTVPSRSEQSHAKANAVVFAHLILTLIALGVISKVLPYSALEPERSEHWVTQTFLLLTIGKIAGGYIWPGIAERTSTRQAATYAHLGSLMLLLLAAAIHLQPGSLTWGLLLLLGAMQGGLNSLAWSMLGERARDGNVPLVVGLFTVAAKCAVGIGGLIAAWIAARTGEPLVPACVIAAGSALVAACLLGGFRRRR